MTKWLKKNVKVTFFASSLSLFLNILAFSIAYASHANTGEGFYDDKELLPWSVQGAWDSVFMVKPMDGNGKLASAVLVGKEEIGPNLFRLTFLSSYHAIDDYCKTLGPCENIELSASKGVLVDAHNQKNLGDVIVNNRNLNVTAIKALRKSVNPDLALVEAIAEGRQFSNLQPVKVTDNCGALKKNHQVFVIGHPIVAERFGSEIARDSRVIKRWSSGYLVTHAITKNKFNGSIEHKTGSTADSLSGNSGGATLNIKGELIGIHNASPGELISGSPYVGNELSNPKKVHALFTRCEFLRDFIEMQPVSNDPQDYYRRSTETSKRNQMNTGYVK